MTVLNRTDLVPHEKAYLENDWLPPSPTRLRIFRCRRRRQWAAEIRRLAELRNATILAHNYQLPSHPGRRRSRRRLAGAVPDRRHAPEETIVFCGVHFMAETAKILSPEKTVLIPDQRAGCSLADSITAQDLRAWKAKHPNALVVSYVNTTAEVKAQTDICCTSSNAVDVVTSIGPTARCCSARTSSSGRT